jgi:hypothetical protein
MQAGVWASDSASAPSALFAKAVKDAGFDLRVRGECRERRREVRESRAGP